MLTYTVRLIRNGNLVAKVRVKAREVMVVGNYYNGIPYQPETDEVIAAVPRMYHKAIRRHVSWWACHNSNSMPLAMNLYTTNSKPMGSLFATPDWL